MTWAALIVGFLVLQRVAFLAGRARGRSEGFGVAMEILEHFAEETDEQVDRLERQRESAPWQ